jgi:hypothetical protein
MDVFYPATPAVFSFLGLLSMCFGQDPLSATMPAMFAATGLVGLLAVRISQSVFSLSRSPAVALAALLVCGPFFRYVSGQYFLSTFMALPVLLFLVWKGVTWQAERAFPDVRQLVQLIAAFVLLLLTYPVLLVLGVALYGSIIVLRELLVYHNRRGVETTLRQPSDFGLRSLTLAGVALGLALLSAPAYVARTFSWVDSLAKVKDVGWTLDLVSPLALLGFPGSVDAMRIRRPEGDLLPIVGLCLVATALMLLGVWRRRPVSSVARQTLILVVAGTLLAYCVVHSRLGPAYQQWKFASYLVMPLSFVPYAAVFAWLIGLGNRHSQSSVWPRRAATATWVFVTGAFVTGNLAIHAWGGEQPLARIDGATRNLEKLEHLVRSREMFVDTSDNGIDSLLVVYFVRNIRLRLIEGYYFHEFESSWRGEVSRERPLLITTDSPCTNLEPHGAIPIPGIGCLLSAPPPPVLETSYRFARTLPFVDVKGLSHRGPSGRWNSSPRVELTIEADARRFPFARVAYLNLLIRPFLPPGTSRQRLFLSWGASRTATDASTTPEWISLPVEPADWRGGQFKALRVALNLPDGVSPASVNPRSTDRRVLAIAFAELALTCAPRGRTIQGKRLLDE